MGGKNLHHLRLNDVNDPFDAGQMVGMLVILTFIEENKGIPVKILEEIKQVTADSLQEHFNKPTEDILLMIDKMVKDTE